MSCSKVNSQEKKTPNKIKASNLPLSEDIYEYISKIIDRMVTENFNICFGKLQKISINQTKRIRSYSTLKITKKEMFTTKDKHTK